MYSCLANVRGIPFSQREMRRSCRVYVVPLPMAYAMYLCHLSFSSTSTPRKRCNSEGLMIEPRMVMVMEGHSFHMFREKSISANLLVLNLELCNVDHSNPPSSWESMSLRVECVSVNVFPVARKMVSSTNAKASSFLPRGTSIKSEL